MMFITVIHARNHADSEGPGTFGQNRRRCGENVSWEGVSDDRDFVAREADGDKAIGGGLRIADYRVTPAKSGGLRAKLLGCHQVAELAMAADDYRNASQLGGGNQREVGVEIEGVCDLNLMAAQIAAQVEASAQRLTSKEAAAEGKLGSIWEVVGERSPAADASDMNLELWRREILRQDDELALGSSRFKSIDHEKQADRSLG